MSEDYEVDISKCGDCNGPVQENSIGEYECRDCGLIQGQAIDMGKDYRTFADGSGANNERHGMKKTYLLHDGGLSTDIGRGNKDAFGQTIKGDFRKRLYRLRMHHQRSLHQQNLQKSL